MKKSYILSLCLAAALAVPAVAQQQNQSNTQDQPQAQSQAQPQSADQNAQPSDQAQGATGKEPLKYERHEGFWGHMNPFARKKYVNRQLDPIRGRVNELDELTGKNAKMIADVDARATEGRSLIDSRQRTRWGKRSSTWNCGNMRFTLIPQWA